jgi:hypothetical protein
MMRRWLLLLLAAPAIGAARATPLPAGLPCASWPTSMAEVNLQNAGLVRIAQLDEAKTRATPIATEKIGADLYRQVFDITLYARSGQAFHVITVNRASSTECSMSGVDVYLVSRTFRADAP